MVAPGVLAWAHHVRLLRHDERHARVRPRHTIPGNPGEPGIRVRRSGRSSLWWAVVTLTTVGYGDVYPITLGGRLFTFIVLMLGLGIVAVPTGLLASALAKAREEESTGGETA